MTNLQALFSTEIWPWVTGTLTFGVVAGALCTCGRIAFQQFRELPLIEYRVVATTATDGKVTEVAVSVFVFNRSPAMMLQFAGLEIVRPRQGVMFGRASDKRGAAYYCGKDIRPASSSPVQYPSAAARAVISSWPSDGADVTIRVLITPRSRLMALKRRTISIRLPKTV